ncbi:UNKNOWN [Stylonychia lemnae]|uniref:Transmembrane protein n=1 Tax=Stylonychia lemnae TaxID=5949 RepID=A0A078A619_STYLE|nr:UNKNOWN [Stylonychia lemnae]|eukprot:CDW77341.1 UNKNOWN [Stylonychia lemnae]
MHSLKGQLRSLDIFGHEVKLLYKGKSAKQTLLGSFMTIISVGLIGFYLVLQIKESFDTALVLIPPFAYSKEQDNEENIYRYINITTILTITTDRLDQDGDRVVEDQHLELFKCSKDRITDNNRISYQIGACDQDYLSKKYSNSTCEKDKLKVQEILKDTYLLVFSSSYYFDPEEFNQSPIKVNTVQNAFRFSSQFEKIVNFEIGLNKAMVSDSKLHENIGSYNREFISTKFVSQGNNDKSEVDPIHFTIQQANNLVMALSNTGGLAGLLFAVVRIIIGPIQEFLYYQSLIQKSFMVEQNRAKDFNTYLELIKRLKNRVPFRYRMRQNIAYYAKKLLLCKKQHFRIQRELFEFGKMKIEKQFDIAVILRDLRTFKMTNSLLLSKYQRKLIPFFKKYQLNQMYERDLQKKEKATKQGERKQFVNEVTQLMIELFSDSQNPSSTYNQVFLHSLFLQNRENAQKDLKSLMYKGVLRYFIQKNLDTRRLLQLSSSSQIKSNNIKSTSLKKTVTLGASAANLEDIKLQIQLNRASAQQSTEEKQDDSPKPIPIYSISDEENQIASQQLKARRKFINL